MSDDIRIVEPSPDLVWFRGPDALSFLNDLLSQDLASRQPGEVVRSMLLSPQGKLDHLLWVLVGANAFGLVTDAGRGQALAATLGRYRIRVQVDIEAESRPLNLVVGGSGEAGSWSDGAEGLRADISWPNLTRTLTTGVSDLPRISDEVYARSRVVAGEPAFGVDFSDRTIPQETGLVDETVSFQKGCYLGQELVARIDSRGRVVRRLVRVEFETAGPQPGDEISHEGETVGRLGTVSGELALAMVRHEMDDGSRIVSGTHPGAIREIRRPLTST